MAKHLHGDVNLLGHDEFGQNPGLNEMWGLGIGGGLAVGTAATVRAVATGAWADNADGVGFAVGAGASAIMFAFPGTRAAGVAGLVSAFLSSGVRQLESWMAKSSKATAGMGVAVVDQLGMPQVNYLNGAMGMAQVSNQPRSYGTVPGVHGLGGTAGVAQSSHLGPPVNLLGGGSPQAAQAQLLGAPVSHGLASRYGANLFGGLS